MGADVSKHVLNPLALVGGVLVVGLPGLRVVLELERTAGRGGIEEPVWMVALHPAVPHTRRQVDAIGDSPCAGTAIATLRGAVV